MVTNNRIEWVDIAKGIGMILVIAGHTIYLGYSFPLYAFHMPLFFFLSGLVFKDKNESFKNYVESKSKSLLKPWIIMILISFLICLSVPQWRSALTIKDIVADFYTANTNTLQNSSLWYLICYFFVLILFYLVKRLKFNHKGILLFFIIAFALLWIRETLELIPLPFHRMPFKIDSALIAIVFFFVAFHYKTHILSVANNKIKWTPVILVTIVSLALCVFNGWSNINSLEFGRIRLLYYPIAFLGIATVCLISKKISTTEYELLKSFLVFYGKSSLLIFGFQSLFIRLYILLFNNIQGIKMELYGDNPIYHQLGAFVIVSFVISPMLVILFDFLRKRNINLL